MKRSLGFLAFLILSFGLASFCLSADSFAEVIPGSGGSSGGSSSSGGNTFSGSTFIYYYYNDTSQDASVAGYDINPECKKYGGFWFLHKRYNGTSVADNKKRKIFGSRITSEIDPNSNYVTATGGGSRVICSTDWTNPINATPECGINRSEMDNPYTNTFPKTWNAMKQIFMSDNGGSLACTLDGVYYGDCFSGPMTYFCHGDYQPDPDYASTYTGTTSIIDAPGLTYDAANSRYVGSSSTETYNVTFSHTIARTDSETAIAPTVSGYIEYWTYHDASKNLLAGPAISSQVGVGSSASTSHIATVTVAPGTQETYCEDLSYESNLTAKAGATYATSSAWSVSSPACITIYRPEAQIVPPTHIATFSATSLIYAYDSNLTPASGPNSYNGVPGVSTYTVSSSHVARRTDSDSEAQATFMEKIRSCSGSDCSNAWYGDVESFQYNSNLGIGESWPRSRVFTITINTPNTSVTYCEKVHYNSTYNPTSSDTYAYTDSSPACITIYRPADPVSIQVANISGSTSIASVTDSNGTSLSCNVSYDASYNCTTTSSGPFRVRFSHTMTRTDSNSAFPRAWYCGAAGASNSPTGSLVAITGVCDLDGSFTPGDSSTKSFTRTLSLTGDSGVLCEAINYPTTITTEGEGNTQKNWVWSGRKCATITKYTVPEPDEATFTGKSEVSSIDYGLTWNAKDNRYEGTSSQSTYEINFAHTISRTDSNTNVSTADFDAQMQDSNTASGPLSNISSGSFSGSLSISGKYTKFHKKTITLAQGTSLTICESVNYNGSVTYLDGNATKSDYKNSPRACITFYRPYPPVTYTARFTGETKVNSIKNASNNNDLVCAYSNHTYYCNTDVNSTKISFNHSVRRTDSTTALSIAPASGRVFSANSLTATSARNYSASAIDANLEIGKSSSIDNPVTMIISTPGANSTYCEELKYTPTYSITGDVESFGTMVAGNRECVTIHRQKIADATFEGKVSYVLDSNLTAGENNTALGTGTTKDYTVNFNYTMRRTDNDNDPTWTNPRYDRSNSRYPSLTDSSATKSFSTGGTWAPVGSDSVSLTIDYGETKRVCAYLSYDNQIIYIDDSVSSRSPNGRAQACISITNPVANITNVFSGETKVEQSLIDNNLQKQADGTWKVMTASSNDRYQIPFVHKLTRLDATNQVYGLVLPDGKGLSRYKIYSNANLAYELIPGESGTAALLRSGLPGSTKVVSGYPLAFRNIQISAGNYKTYCEQMRYDVTSTLHGSTMETTYSGYDGRSEACITLKRPITIAVSCSNRSSLCHYYYFYVNGRSIPDAEGGLENLTGLYREDGILKTKSINAELTFNHEMARENDSFSGFTVSPSYNVIETKKKGEEETRNVIDLCSSESSCSTRAILDSGDTFSSIVENRGKTESGVDSSLKAGETETICHNIYYVPAVWYMLYEDRGTQDTYTDHSKDEPMVITTRNVYKSGPVIASTEREEGEIPVCVDIHRPWNYSIESADPSAEPSSSFVTAHEEVSPSFKINVEREDENINYITDMDNPRVAVFEFVVQGGVEDKATQTRFESATKGSAASGLATAGSAADICETFYGPRLASNLVSCNLHDNTTYSLPDYKGKEVYDDDSYSVTFNTSGVTIPGIEIGQKFCVAIAVQKPMSSGSLNQWYVSSATCFAVVKRPSLQVTGGGVLAAGGIITSETDLDGIRYGSWSELSLIANKKITHMASGNSLPAEHAINCPWSLAPLTISNVNSLSGCDATTRLGYANVSARTSLADRLNDYFASSTVSRFADVPSVISPNSRIIYKTSGTLTIDHNIIYSEGPYSDGGSVPLVIIFANNVNIDESVTRIDAWIISTGEIDTCYNYNDTSLTTRVCDQKLTFNGPIVAKRIKFKRTYGSESPDVESLKTSAETVNYSPAAFLRASGETDWLNLDIVYQRKLSPRK